MFKILALFQPNMQPRKMTVWESLAKKMQSNAWPFTSWVFCKVHRALNSSSKGSVQSTKFYVLNIIYPTDQAPSCVSGSTSQEHLHIDNTQYQDCCRGDSWRRSESYPRWRVFELCSSGPLGGHPLFSGLLIQPYYQFTTWWTHYLYT